MSDILEDIVKDIDIKPSKSKLVLKWVVRAASVLIGGAFVFGQLKMSHLNKLDEIQKSLEAVSKNQVELKSEMDNGFKSINARVDKVYADGFKAFDDYQQFNNKQLGLIIDYGRTDKELLKRMLELSNTEKTKSIENQLEQAKNDNTSFTPQIKIKEMDKNDVNALRHVILVVPEGSKDTLFRVSSATKEFIDKIDKNRYRISQITDSKEYPGLFDVNYTNK